MNTIKRKRYGAGCLLTRPDVLNTRKKLIEEGIIGHVQLLMIPMERRSFQEAVEQIEDLYGMIRIHAPHHNQQVNPCAPELYRSGEQKEIKAYFEEAMNQTFEAADRTGSEIIVLHAGRYRPGDKEHAVDAFHEFLDLYPDERYIIENLPNLKTSPYFLGITPDELQMLGKGKVKGYCIDFPHLWCTSLSLGESYEEFLSAMSSLPVMFSHLSGSPGPDDDRQHLLIDDPENRFNPDLIKGFLMEHQDLEISLEFPHDDPAVIKMQMGLLP